MGMLVIHLIILAIEEYYGVIGDSNVLCDNKGALYTFKKRSKQIPAGAKNNDIQKVLWQVKNKTKSIHLLHHVKSIRTTTRGNRTYPWRPN